MNEDDEDYLLNRAEVLAQARVEFADAFLAAKAREGTTDETARQLAIFKTKGQLTVAEATYQLALARIQGR